MNDQEIAIIIRNCMDEMEKVIEKYLDKTDIHPGVMINNILISFILSVFKNSYDNYISVFKCFIISLIAASESEVDGESTIFIIKEDGSVKNTDIKNKKSDIRH